jgi:hypothetical protein
MILTKEWLMDCPWLDCEYAHENLLGLNLPEVIKKCRKDGMLKYADDFLLESLNCLSGDMDYEYWGRRQYLINQAMPYDKILDMALELLERV